MLSTRNFIAGVRFNTQSVRYTSDIEKRKEDKKMTMTIENTNSLRNAQHVVFIDRYFSSESGRIETIEREQKSKVFVAPAVLSTIPAFGIPA